MVSQQRLMFVLMGQSNMSGRGAVADLPHKDDAASHRIFCFGQRTDQWQQAIDPLHADKPEKAGVGPALSFSHTVLHRLPAASAIYLVPCSWGGTALSEWLPDGDKYKETVRRVRLSIETCTPPSSLAGVLWHQGESDCGDTFNATKHAEKSIRTVDAFRRELAQPDLPWIVGELGYFLDQQDQRFAQAGVVNQGIVQLPSQVAHCACVSAYGLGHRGDRLHFDTAAQAALGRRYADAWLSIVGERFGPVNRCDSEPMESPPLCFPHPNLAAPAEEVTSEAVID